MRLAVEIIIVKLKKVDQDLCVTLVKILHNFFVLWPLVLAENNVEISAELHLGLYFHNFRFFSWVVFITKLDFIFNLLPFKAWNLLQVKYILFLYHVCQQQHVNTEGVQSIKLISLFFLPRFQNDCQAPKALVKEAVFPDQC